jgi:hypothetical protein
VVTRLRSVFSWKEDKMHYEAGMQIIWDMVARNVIIIFRNTVVDLAGPFEDEQTAIAQAESRCLELGWNPEQVLALAS